MEADLYGLRIAQLLLPVTGHGGLGSLFNFLIHPQVRAYNPISIHIDFFPLLAVATLLDDLQRKLQPRGSRNWLWYGSLAILLSVGILDQTTSDVVPHYDQLSAQYSNDAEFVARVEASLPPGR